MAYIAKNPILLGILVLFVYMPAAMDAHFGKDLGVFSNNMLHQLMANNNEKSIIYSPLSIYTALNMLRLGAEGETEAELTKVLNTIDSKSPQSAAEDFHTFIDKYKDGSILHLANKIYVNKGYDLDATYSQMLETNYLAAPETLNFNKPNRASNAINKWVQDATDNNIRNIVSASSLNGDTRLVLLSAIHFKGLWEHPFKRRQTRKRDFFTSETESKQVDMMHAVFEDTNIKHGRHDNFHFLRMPYKDCDLSMMIFVPWKRDGFNKMLEIIQNSTMHDYTKGMRERSVDVLLPKFKVEFKMDLKEPLKKLGLVRLFQNAELGKMFSTSHENTYISSVVHKAIIEVNESGTKASAATGLMDMDKMAPYPFEADHSFYYAIIDEDDNILFQGTYTGL